LLWRSATRPYAHAPARRNAARIACIALLAQQGMRATTNGGHYAVEAQFGEGFRPFALGGR